MTNTGKLISLVEPEERSELVTQVRIALNVAGDDRLDAPLQELLRGLQHRLGIPAVGCINIATLDALAVAPPEW
jgi:L-alanine-DL-glutamate epimerase-like enolase superfamily enzyme